MLLVLLLMLLLLVLGKTGRPGTEVMRAGAAKPRSYGNAERAHYDRTSFNT